MTTRSLDMKPILVPVDYSDASQHALGFAAFLAERLGADLELIHFWECPPFVRDAQLDRATAGHPLTLAGLVMEQARSELGDFLLRANLPSALKVDSRLAEGHPARGIVALSESGEHSWVVMGTTGRTGLGHIMLGSTAEYVVRFSKVPVMTVPRRHASS